ncbi:MAG TPA: hypothetical protein VGM90_15835 [Kofleriaceae bacterium]|jgi:hypothetical protein
MRLAIASIALAVAGASLTGCTLYFGNGDDNQTCGDIPVSGTAVGGAPAYQLRDPYTNTCSYYGGGGYPSDCYYDSNCNYICNGSGYGGAQDGGPYPSPPPQTGSDGGIGSGWGSASGSGGSVGSGSDAGGGSGGANLAPIPDYPQCGTRCDQLSENDCLAAAECQATYTNNYYAYPPGEPAKACGGVSNYQCEAGESCIHDGNYPDTTGHCEANNGGGGSGSGGSGGGSGGTMDPNVPVSPTSFAGCYSTGTDYGSSGSCYGLDANACVHRDDCSPVYDNYGYGSSFDSCIPEPQANNSCDNVYCGSGAHCEQECITEDSNNPFTDCVAQCVPDGDSCASVDCAPGYTCVDTCDTMTPDAAGNTPAGQCWASCQPTESCNAITDQNQCDSRSDCTSVYDGENCTCYPGGYCDCEVLTWKRCDDVNAMPL